MVMSGDLLLYRDQADYVVDLVSQSGTPVVLSDITARDSKGGSTSQKNYPTTTAFKDTQIEDGEILSSAPLLKAAQQSGLPFDSGKSSFKD